MDKSEATQKLKRQRELLLKIQATNEKDPAFTEWRRDTEIAIEFIFGKDSRHPFELRTVRWSAPAPPSYNSVYSSASARHRVSGFEEGRNQADALLRSMIKEVDEYGLESRNVIKETTLPVQREPSNVLFIGHGSSKAWRDLKDFIQERLHLRYDEFNRVPVAGKTNIARLSEMLDAASIAFLIMTAEDELADGKIHARMNVIHEAGLFQGRLGFTKAIVLLEDGCEEFSNIEGHGQIRFPKNDIVSTFEEIRRVLEREEIIKKSKS